MNIPNLNAIRDWANKKFSLVSATGCDLGLSIDTSTYVMTLELKNSAGQVLSSKTIDFPIESMVVNASYKDGKLTLTLQNGQTLVVDISAIVSGLVNDTRTIAGLDLKDDISKEELITALGIPAWAMAANKPSYTAAEVGALPSDTKIPTTVAELTDAKDYAKTTDVEALSGRMDTAESDIETLETSTAALDERLDTAEQNITNQGTRLTEAEDTIDQHSSHIAEISAEIKVEKSIVVDDYALVDSGNGVLNDLMLYGRSHQDGTPTPENPSAIRALDRVGTANKNLFDGDVKNWWVSDGKIVNGSSSIHRAVCRKVNKGTVYTISINSKFQNGYIRYCDEIPSIGVSLSGTEAFGFNTLSSASTTAIGDYLVVFLYNDDISKDFQIEEGSTVTSYVPHASTESALPTLYGIPVASGGNYVDKDGQHWISDVLDLEKGEITRYCYKFKASDLNWRYSGSYASFINSTTLTSMAVGNGLCTHYVYKDSISLNDSFSVATSSILRIKDDSFGNDASAFMDWLSEHDVDIIVPLATPLTEPIPQATINSIRQLRSFADKTHIYCDNGSLEAVIAENTEVGNAIGRNAIKINEILNLLNPVTASVAEEE